MLRGDDTTGPVRRASTAGRTGAARRTTPTRRANTLGAVSLRVVVALGASTGLTAAVALPMAYQAHQARQQDRLDAERQSARTAVEVLGRTTVPVESADVGSDGLGWASTDGTNGVVPMQGATITGRGHVVVDLPGLSRIDVRVDDGPTLTVASPPWRVPADEELDAGELDPGEHAVVATLTFSDGRTELRRATFLVPG